MLLQGIFKSLENGAQDEEKDLIRDVDVIERDLSNHIKLAPIINRLIDMGFPIKDTIVSFKSINDNAFIYVGREPLSEDAFFSL